MFPFFKIIFLQVCLNVTVLNHIQKYFIENKLLRYTDPHSLVSIFWVTDDFKMYLQFFSQSRHLPPVFYTHENARMLRRKRKTMTSSSLSPAPWPMSLSSFTNRKKNVSTSFFLFFSFRSLIHFEFIFVSGVEKCFNFTLLHVAVQFSQHTYLLSFFF